jgi:3-phosphoglycerate kinase
MSAAVSAAKSVIRNGPSGVLERPTPRLSKVVTR